MGKGIERRRRIVGDPAESTLRTTVREQMLKRDADLEQAVRSLEAVARALAAGIAELGDLTGRNLRVAPADLEAFAAREADFAKAPDLAGEINRVVHDLRLLQAAVDRASPRRRRDIASKS
jgi:predicted NBD/HSP70 family sugar kinase